MAKKRQLHKFKDILPNAPFDDGLNELFSDPVNLKLLLKDPDSIEHGELKSMNDISTFMHQLFSQLAEEEKETEKEEIVLSDDECEGLYSMGHNLYESGRYQDAINIFRFLMMTNPYEYKYTFGLAACMQMEKDYHEATSCYLLAATLKPDQPLPHFHSAECYLKLEDLSSVCISLSLAIKSAGDQEKYASLKSRCELSRAQFVKQLKSEAKKNKLKKLSKKKGKS